MGEELKVRQQTKNVHLNQAAKESDFMGTEIMASIAKQANKESKVSEAI